MSSVSMVAGFTVEGPSPHGSLINYKFHFSAVLSTHDGVVPTIHCACGSTAH